MTPIRVSPSWLAVREPADVAARAGALVDEIRHSLPADRPLVIYDLGCGTGATMRWLAPQLRGPQHWIGYDLDAHLLGTFNAAPAQVAADGSPVTTETRCRDVTQLKAGDLADATLITCSALLDLLSADELDRLVRSCASALCPVLITLTVTGAVRLSPRHPLDELVAAAFNSHQRRTTGGRRLLGPDAADAARRMFTELGCDVMGHASPWRLGPARRQLTYAWFAGWLAAACEQDSHLATATRSYARVRLAGASAGRLQALVQHRDLLVRSPRRPGQPDADRSRTR